MNNKILYRNHGLQVTNAPEPTDILWNNMNMTTEERTRRWVKSNLYFFIFISSYFLSIFLLKLGLKQVNKYVLDYD